MPRSFRVRSVADVTGETAEARGTFSDDEWRTLLLFVKHADELNRTRLVQRSGGIKVHLHWTADAGFDHQSDLPPQDELDEFLYRLRRFILEGEPASFYKVCNILTRHFTHPLLREPIQNARALFSGKTFRSLMEWRVDDVVLNSEKKLMEWLNAFEYHTDLEKQPQFEGLDEIWPIPALYLSMLTDKTNAIFTIARLVIALDQKTSLRFGPQHTETARVSGHAKLAVPKT